IAQRLPIERLIDAELAQETERDIVLKFVRARRLEDATTTIGRRRPPRDEPEAVRDLHAFIPDHHGKRRVDLHRRPAFETSRALAARERVVSGLLGARYGPHEHEDDEADDDRETRQRSPPAASSRSLLRRVARCGPRHRGAPE